MKRIAVLFGATILLACCPAVADQAEEKKPLAEKKIEKPVADKPVTVPIEVLKTKHLAISVKINGKGPYRMIFDTGAPVTLVSSKVGKESGMIGKDAKVPAFTLFGAMGQFPIQSLEVGTLKAEK